MPEYQILGQYRRTVSAIPSQKRLIEVGSLNHQPIPFGTELGQLCPDVVFYALTDGTGARYWARRWLNGRQALLEPTIAIESFLATLHRNDLCLAVDVSSEFGLVYFYEEELFASTTIVHQWDCEKYFDVRENRIVEEFAYSVVRWPGLPAFPIGVLTDFQIVRTSKGLVFLDFEPSKRFAAELAGVLIP